jgi:membrane protein YdbS with pleckstrin-like domain
MAAVTISEEYAWSLIAKTAVALAIFWITVSLMIGVLEFAGSRVELVAGGDNAQVIMMLAFASLILLAIIEFVYVNLLKRTTSMKYDDSAVTFSSGFIGRSETVMPFSGIKSVHTVDERLRFIDNLFGIATITVHADQTMIIPGVKNAIQVVKEISDRAAAKKEKKADPMELVMKEITALKTEVASLKKRLEEKERKERAGEERKEPKKKFVLRPFEEAL